ncbi:RelA/SpoT domain-containing protein [Thioclava sp. A2]|uniref:RelA/SpoT domain-containing protein n=1 Tax=Thioclava sp. FCG-A2 TaxID=3080562 RepID=UPI002952BA01|nr:RelA/SpoT domain-containing protein [Thioclava sp. A2]
MISKSKIDKAGKVLSDKGRVYDELSLELDYIFEDFRKAHLEPLTKLTLDIQSWLQNYGQQYYIAQRLKRRPQILRKLRRFSVRLSQLQDIGGCRIVVETNEDANKLISYLLETISCNSAYEIVRETDYRDWGRDDSGYRAFHFILKHEGRMMELQIRSRLQHYWSESIERTSVIYGKRLKEQEGDAEVLHYFKLFSDALHFIEQDRRITSEKEIELQRHRELAEAIIGQSTRRGVLSSYVNENIIKTLTEVEKGSESEFNNWILVFDWRDGNFCLWDVVKRHADEAVEAYQKYESQYLEEDKYEVVMIGSSDISSVKHTHSHYFGIEHHSNALEEMENAIIGLSARMSMDVGARRILSTLNRQGRWGKKNIKVDTLKNHFCQNVATFHDSLELLRGRGFIIGDDPISLDIKKNREIRDLV